MISEISVRCRLVPLFKNKAEISQQKDTAEQSCTPLLWPNGERKSDSKGPGTRCIPLEYGPITHSLQLHLPPSSCHLPIMPSTYVVTKNKSIDDFRALIICHLPKVPPVNIGDQGFTTFKAFKIQAITLVFFPDL